MKIQVIKDLVKVADSLDRKGLYKESDMVDALINKMASYVLGGPEAGDPERGREQSSSRGGDHADAVLQAEKKIKVSLDAWADACSESAQEMKVALDSGRIEDLKEMVEGEIEYLEEMLAEINIVTMPEEPE